MNYSFDVAHLCGLWTLTKLAAWSINMDQKMRIVNLIHSSNPIANKRRLANRNSNALKCRSALSSSHDDTTKPSSPSSHREGRRALIASLLSTAGGIYVCDVAEAASTSRRALRASKIPESDFTTLSNGLKYYDLKVGGGPKALKGSRVAVHYVAKWKGITFMTSRQGLGVGGGTPYGFDVGQSERGAVLKGLDLGVEGMRVGGQVIPISAVL
ncbi:hypothetical protein DKX38_024212 [Salix brachista]|uniref:peptidylprolyl isomerase n=1 Tax=Salix brachista TaxID=2182728 RepID=A0A5N5JRB7_9ROSI|nr:hypothetical protein DKX38_024212 [Salix brachista]